MFIDVSDASEDALFYSESADGHVLRVEAVRVGTAGAPLGTRTSRGVSAGNAATFALRPSMGGVLLALPGGLSAVADAQGTPP